MIAQDMLLDKKRSLSAPGQTLHLLDVQLQAHIYAQINDRAGDVRSWPSKGCRVSNKPYPFWKTHLRQNLAFQLRPRGRISHPPGLSWAALLAELARKPGEVRS